jgi:hypothetical protein
MCVRGVKLAAGPVGVQSISEGSSSRRPVRSKSEGAVVVAMEEIEGLREVLSEGGFSASMGKAALGVLAVGMVCWSCVGVVGSGASIGMVLKSDRTGRLRNRTMKREDMVH